MYIIKIMYIYVVLEKIYYGLCNKKNVVVIESYIEFVVMIL